MDIQSAMFGWLPPRPPPTHFISPASCALGEKPPTALKDLLEAGHIGDDHHPSVYYTSVTEHSSGKRSLDIRAWHVDGQVIQQTHWDQDMNQTQKEAFAMKKVDAVKRDTVCGSVFGGEEPVAKATGKKQLTHQDIDEKRKWTPNTANGTQVFCWTAAEKHAALKKKQSFDKVHMHPVTEAMASDLEDVKENTVLKVDTPCSIM